MLHREQRDHIAHVLARTRDAGTAPAADVIERSWLRCVNDYGMDPTRQIPARIIEAGQLRERQDQVESFMRVARVGMEQLYKRVSSLGYVLLLTDAEGIAVDYIAHDALRDELKRSGLYLGSDWSELRAGTCGVGTCYGMDPTRQIPARIIEAGQLRERQDQVESFMRVARVGMEQLYKRVSSLGYVLLLTDAEGIAVDYIAHDALRDELKRSGLYLGSDWSELRAGTCGVGTCIVERTPVICHGADHFDASHIQLSVIGQSRILAPAIFP